MSDPHINRRTFCQALAASVGGGLSLSPSLVAAVEQAFAVTPDAGTTFLDAEHIVFLMQENRSFDHMFGSLQGVRGFNDPRAISLPGGRPVWLQAHHDGAVYAPFHLDMRNSKATWLGDVPHSWPNQVDARNQGKYDQWIPAKTKKSQTPMTLGYYTRADIPFYYAMADAFTVCDQHFCSSLTGTTPNRLFFWTGTVRAEPKATSKPLVYNGDSDHTGRLHWVTFPDRLTDLNIPWKIYQNELTEDAGLEKASVEWLANFGDNSMEYFKQYHARFSPGCVRALQQREVAQRAEVKRLEEVVKKAPNDGIQVEALAVARAAVLKTQQAVTEFNAEAFARLPEREQKMHRQGCVTNVGDPNYHEMGVVSVVNANGKTEDISVPLGDLFHQFRSDVNAGKLPSVSWLVAPRNFSDHASSPWFGAWYVSEALNILTKNPAVWKKTIFILTYDENDGYFDHCPPFVAPQMDDYNTGLCSPSVDSTLETTTRDRNSPIGLGYRVPMIIASPWTRGGWVNSEVCDHTSNLRLLEQWITHKFKVDIRETNISSWRRTISGDLTSAFRPWNGEAIPTPTFLDQRTWMETIHQARIKPVPDPGKPLTQDEIDVAQNQPQQSKRLAQQEPGTRPACALPYDVIADGALNSARTAVHIDLAVLTRLFKDRTAGCPFTIYAPGRVVATGATAPTFDDVRTWNYAVAAGEKLQGVFPLALFPESRYHLRINGPNGFYRELIGDAKDPGMSLQVDTEVNEAGQVTDFVRVRIVATSAMTLRLTANAYEHAAQTQGCVPGQPVMMRVPLTKSHGWYDFTLSVENHPNYTRRYAGRCENGQAQRTDPVMGRSV